MSPVGVDLQSLPDDPEALRALLAAAMAKCEALTEERDVLAARNEKLRHLLDKLQRMQFGRRSERLPEDQLQFAFEEVEASLAGNEAEAEKRSPELRKQNTASAGRACEGVVVQVPAPARLIEGGMPTEATVAHVLVSRCADHLPLYRQAQILARQGLTIGREVLACWVGTAAAEIASVVARMRELLLASVRLFADETTMPVLDPGRGQTKTGYAWAIARDD